MFFRVPLWPRLRRRFTRSQWPACTHRWTLRPFRLLQDRAWTGEANLFRRSSSADPPLTLFTAATGKSADCRLTEWTLLQKTLCRNTQWWFLMESTASATAGLTSCCVWITTTFFASVPADPKPGQASRRKSGYPLPWWGRLHHRRKRQTDSPSLRRGSVYAKSARVPFLAPKNLPVDPRGATRCYL